MKHCLLALSIALCATAALADGGSDVVDGRDLIDSAPAPTPAVAGQTWTYKQTVRTAAGTRESHTIFRLANKNRTEGLIIESLPSALTGRPTVWHKGAAVDSDSCMIDFFGAGSLGIINSCNTSFTPGMDWTTESVINGVRVTQRYEVLDTEYITVEAGSFHAIKIDAVWHAGAGKSTRAPSHHITYWYAPETRTMVKVHREFLNGKGKAESESTEELQKFRENIAR